MDANALIYNNEEVDTNEDEELDDDVNDQQFDVNEYSNLQLIMNSNVLLNGEYGLCYKRCLRCNRRLEFYGDDALASLIVACGILVHRECSLAAPLILEMIMATLK
jgi:hypothetical protein